MLLFLLPFATFLHAQDSLSPVKWNFGGGFSVGSCFSFPVGGEDKDLFKPQIIFGGQLLAEYQHKKFSIGFGLNYSERASRYSLINGIDIDDGEWDVRTYNVGVPLSFKYYPLQRKKANFFIALNANFDFPIYYTTRLEYTSNGTTYEDKGGGVNDGVFDYFNPTIGISFGGELKLRNNFVRIEPYVNFAPVTIPVFFEDVYPLSVGVQLSFFSSKIKK